MPAIRKFLFRLSASTQLRNRDVAASVRPFLKTGETVVDAGCGEFGLASFLAPAKVVGVDIVRAGADDANFEFVPGSIVSLPFDDASVAVSASVDTIEHLPAVVRAIALAEMVRVSSKAVVVSFPRGDDARRIDEAYRADLRRYGRSEPDWLSEHLAERYPTEQYVERILRKAAGQVQRSVEVKTSYSEWTWFSRLIRTADSRSPRLALLIDLALGILGLVVPRPPRDRSYRAIVTARFV